MEVKYSKTNSGKIFNTTFIILFFDGSNKIIISRKDKILLFILKHTCILKFKTTDGQRVFLEIQGGICQFTRS